MAELLEKEGKLVKKSFWFCEGCSYDRGKCIVLSRRKPEKCIFNQENYFPKDDEDEVPYCYCKWYKQTWGEGLKSIAATLDVQECIQPDYYEPEPKRPSSDTVLL